MSAEANAVVSIADGAPVPHADGQQVMWAQWKALVNEFGATRLLSHLMNSRSGWGFYDVDVVGALRATPMGQGALAILSPLSRQELSVLKALAHVNTRRNDAMWKMSALFYVSVPLTLILAGLQGAPGIVRLFAREAWIGFAICLLPTIVFLLCYFITNWRAHQIEALIELAQIERSALEAKTIPEDVA